MSRTVRRVPPDWIHPTDPNTGRLRPLFDGYAKHKAEWIAMYESDGYDAAVEWWGGAPAAEDYMPEWPESERTHLMMYETTSEGTPISPAFATAEQLARWLADNKASAFGDMTATYDQWLATCGAGSAFSLVVTDQGLKSGVEYEAGSR